ncbi:GHMP family kinase ATP-binding protein [Dyadobacter fermentans]|uniref:GHMP kinase n=1 Tax=Dyadobacter fermentans (strain ATCC 700827 / DSM 18053 / CIP 107007 / KCTC 52180 / NS114) TaxID=471854 RepID=C6VZC2_DYAFD|nr:galactokinase family protein [Dyadobacter fermentans]ACT91734.1 GHMP kinase [Dyadobacter fermentans DSM 18053]
MRISTPGRICLFGEHQDYLGLPVIAAAISRRISVEGARRDDNKIILNLPDLGSKEAFSLDTTFPYVKQRDYFRSTINVVKRKGLTFSKGFEVTIQGNIPINSGTSSSSALIVSWAHFLDKLSDNPLNFSKKELGEIANAAEVLEFGEPGGMMDNYSTAIGNVIYLESTPVIKVEALTPKLGTFVLGDSLEPKDTLGIIARCRYGMEEVIKIVTDYDPSFSIFTTPISKLTDYKSVLTNDQLSLLNANIEDRDILVEGKALLIDSAENHAGTDFDNRFGHLLYKHYQNLRDHKRTSTPKIERMMNAALGAGALGGKINGSGGGGCMFAYAPTHAEEVAEAIEREGGKSYIITVDEGTRVEG